jgi:hypothetical protein
MGSHRVSILQSIHIQSIWISAADRATESACESAVAPADASVTANRLLLSTSGSSHRPALRATGPVEESALATHGRPLEGEEFA